MVNGIIVTLASLVPLCFHFLLHELVLLPLLSLHSKSNLAFETVKVEGSGPSTSSDEGGKLM